MRTLRLRLRTLAMLTSLAAAAGCAASASHASTAAGAADAADVRRVVDAVLAPYDRADAPGASVAVIRNGVVVYERSAGLARLEGRVPATPRTNYRLASVTKQFTAMSVLLLVRDGKLRLDEPLTELFPGFPAYGQRITVRHLLTHTSGLIDYEDLMAPGETRQIHDRGVLELLERVDSTYFAPGTRWRYSNSGFALLSLAVERASGMPFARFLRERVFGPAGMTRSVAYEQGVSEVADRAYGYTPNESGFRLTDQSSTSAVLGDGGIYSSVEDLARWDRALAEHRLLDSATFAAAITPQASANAPEPERGVDGDPPATGYGYGWFVDHYRGHFRTWHYGETVGFRTRIVRFPEDHLTVIVLANRADAKPGEMSDRIVDAVLK